MVNHALGESESSRAALQALTALGDSVPSTMLGVVNAYLGNTDEAFAWLEKSIEGGDPGALSVSRFSPELDSLRQDPRWEALMARIGLSDQQLSEIRFENFLPE